VLATHFSFTTFVDPRMRPLCVLLFIVLLSSCRDPRAEANIAEAMVQVDTEMSAIRQDYAVLQNQVDSLRGVVARQDTLLARLATMANVPPPAK
jgi:hypothetical protein